MNRGLLIDLDGTLADSIAPLKQVYHRFLSHFQVTGSEVEFQRLNGPPLPDIIAYLRHTHHLAPTEVELLDLYRSLIHQAQGHIPPAVRAQHVLQTARERGWQLAIVTSSAHATTEAWLHQNGLREWIDAIVGGDDVTEGKPNPAPYRLGLQKLGVKATQSLAVEDSPQGATAAIGAGIATLVINPSNMPAEHWPAGTRQIRTFADVIDSL